MPICKDDLVSWITEKVAMTGSKGLSTDEIWSLLNLQSEQTDTVEDVWKCLALQTELVLHKCSQSTNETIPLSYSSQHSYEETTLKYGRHLYWIATPAKQTHYLLQGQQATLPPLQRTILEKIGSSGATGIAQCVIATDLELKPQKIFHHLKKLQSLQLITRTPSIYQGRYTNTCVHVHYSKSDNANTTGNLDPLGQDGSVRYDEMVEKINRLLSKAKDKTMALSDLIRLAGFTSEQQLKWARKFITKQHADGFVEKLMATANGKNIMCVKLIKQITISTQKVSSNPALDKGPPSTEELGPHQKKTHALTMESLIKYIASKHGNGCTNKDLYQAFSNNGKTAIDNMVKKTRTAQDSELVAIKELQGRSHVLYYFSKEGFKEYQSIKGKTNSPSTSSTDYNGNQLSTDRENSGNRETQSGLMNIKRRLSIEDSEPKRRKPLESSHNPTRDINLTMARRKSALLDIINRDKVRDFNNQLFDEIQSVDGSDKKHRLARKTALRLVDSLEKEGLLRLIKVMPNNIFGGNQPRTLLLSPQLDESDQAVQDYLGKSVTVPSGRSVTHGTSLKTVDTEVTRYGCGPHQYEILPERHWRFIAKRHGWIESKWLRAKELHLFLVKSLLHRQGNSDTLDNDVQYALPLATLIGTMTLDLFKKVIGIQQHDPTLEEFVENNQDPGLVLGNIPDNIRHHLIPNTYYMRRRIQTLLSTLEALELLQPSTITQGNSTYTLQLVGLIRNYTLPDNPIIAEKRFTTIDSVIDYWNELQYTCACIYGTENDRGSLGAKKDGDPLSTIVLSRTWTNGDNITADQKCQLDQHVDFSLGKVPNNEWPFLSQLSRATGLLPYRIRSYYLNLGTAFAKRNRLGQQLLNEQQLTGTGDNDNKQINSQSPPTTNTVGKRKRPLDNTIQILLRASKEKKAISQVPDHERHSNEAFSSPTFIGSRSLRRKYIKTLDGTNLKTHYRPISNVKRTIKPFTSSEKSTFMYAVAIMRYRARQSKFYWAPITQVIPEKSIRQCASRLQSLIALNSPSLQTIDTLQQKWARIYTRGLQRKEITDERPWDTRNFDLTGYMTYFLSQLLVDVESPPPIAHSITLPINTHITNSLYTLTPVSHPTSGPPDESKHWREKTSPNTMGNAFTDNQVHDEKRISVAKAIQMIKMIMVHPEETFDPHLAYNLLSQCHTESVEEAYSYLKSSGMVVLSKHGDNRRVPGRKFRMSNSFTLALAGPVSKQLYEDAFEFHQHVYLGQPIPDNLTSGIMMALLNLTSQLKINLVNGTNEQFMQHISSLVYPKPNRHHDSFIEHWARNHENLRINTKESSLTLPSSDTMINRTTQPTRMITSGEAEKRLGKRRLKQSQYAKHVYDALNDFDVKGATVIDLKLKLESLGVPLTDKELLKTLERLMDHNPSLAVKVGYNNILWICVPHAKQWMMKSSISTMPEIYLPMNLWCNLDGSTNHDMLYVCSSSLVGHIQSKPGISQEELEQQYPGSLSKAECQQILDLLVCNGIIYYRSVIKQPKPSLFSKPCPKTIDQSVNITRYSIRYYFTHPDHYYKLCLLRGKKGMMGQVG